ncbi:hypothetical protein Q1695_005043 [Nippostrongylus brasiliensis]|nr:hypothetical protein Q1695_005043 [Nippostrongylus brasiliensis]
MRLFLLAACLVCALASRPLDEHESVKKVLRTWLADKQVEIVDHPESPRELRAVAAVAEGSHGLAQQLDANKLSVSRSCNTPGYTGEFCEFPICYETNPTLPPVMEEETVAIDASTLANCTQQYVVYVDESMYAVSIDIEMDSPLNPTFTLQGEDGSVANPDLLTQTRDHVEAVFGYLPPGRYLVIPSADLKTTSCVLSVRARTSITVTGGFLLGEGTASERSDYPQKYTYYQQLASVVVHANSLRSPAKLQSINFIGEENTMYRPRLLSTRYNCSYEYIFESFFCKSTGSYLYQVEGVSFQGFTFRRLFPFSCLVNPATTAAPPSTVAPTEPAKCKNNGIFVKNLDGSTYCYCLGLYTGADCGTRVCANGGTPDSNGKCMCAAGFMGEFCENVYCTDNTGLAFDAEHPTLTLVIRTRQQLSDVIAQVSRAVQTMVNDLTFDPDYLRRYVLVLFNNNKATTNSYPDSISLLDALSAAAKTTDTSGGCSDVTFNALSAALSQYLTYKSPVYVITDAVPSDGSEVDNVYHLANDWRSPIHFIYLEPKTASGCKADIEDSAYRLMDTVAQRSSGQTFYFQDYSKIETFLTQHFVNTIYRTQLLLSNDLPVCSDQLVYKAVSVDVTVQMFVIVATGRNISLVLTNPDGEFAKSDVAYTDGINNIWVYNGPYTGNWLFNIRSSGSTQACNFKVFQSVYHTPGTRDNQMDLFWSTSADLDSDVGLNQPLVGFEHAFVMHLTNYPVAVPPERVQAFLTITANRGGQTTQVYASNGIWRDLCSYNFYFPPFACKIPNEILYYNFYAQDLYGFAVQRAGVMYCAEIPPPPTQTSGCQNGGVMNAANTTCFCPPGFTGDFCTQVECYNGGKYVGNQCSCQIGWTGTFCEIPKCIDKGISPEFMMNYVDMVFMVELTAQAHAQVVSLNQQFADLIRDVQAQSQTWINRFYLVGYNSTWADVLAVSPSSDPHEVIDTLNRIAGTIPTDTGCKVQLWQAFIKMLQWNIPAGSFVQIFQTSPENDGNLDTVAEIYDAMRALYININGFLSYTPTFKPNGFACNATQIDYETVFAMVGGSDGTVYPVQPGNIQDIAQIIPLLYSSGQVYGQWSFQCKTPMQVYFPIDAYTQTIQLNTFGYNKKMQVFDANGNVVQGYSLVSDAYSGWDILEIRKDCDAGWDKAGQYCLQFVINQKSFADAQRHCHEAGGNLVDDLNDGKHQFIASVAHGFSFWLGLYNNNGTGYVWDRPDGVAPLPLNQNQQYWNGGGAAPPYDPKAACVFWDGSTTNTNTWTLGNCNTALPFLCQKHQYDKDHRPNVIGDDDLPAGKWSMSISVNPAAGQMEVCSVAIKVQSSLQLITGFATDVYTDTPYLDPIGDSQTNRLISYLHSLDNAHRTPILTHSLLYDAYNGTFYNAATYNARVGCSFPWVSQTFPCPNGQNDANEFFIAHIGEDEFGNMFQRATLAHCNKADLSCGSGGVRYNGTCVCTEYWTGRFCTVPICVNGGVRSTTTNQCVCPKGYTGPNCQLEECTSPSPVKFTTDAKSLVFAIEVTKPTLDAVKGLVSQLSAIVSNATAVHPNWFANYVLVTFDSTGPSAPATFSSINALVMSLNSAVSRATDAGGCSLPIYKALTNALSQKVAYPNSELFLITAATPGDNTAKQAGLEEISDTQAHVNYIYLTSAACTPSDAAMNPMVQTAYTSGGNVAFVDSTNLNSYLNAYLATLYGSSVLSNPTFHSNYDCSTPRNWYVQVDMLTTAIYVSSTSQYGSLGVIDPLNQDMAPKVLYNAGRTKLYEIDADRLPGIYTLTVTSPGSCYVHVYSAGGAKVFSEFATTTTNDPLGSHQDGSVPHPSTGGLTQFPKIRDIFNKQVMLRSPLYRRGMCSFEYYSDPFVCQSQSLEFMVIGMDEFNQQFRRLEQFFCVSHNDTTRTTVPSPVVSTTPYKPVVTTQPVVTTMTTQPVVTTNPPPVTTQPAPVMSTSPSDHLTTPAVSSGLFDVVFLIDVSQEASTRLSDMNNFVSSLMSGFIVSQQNSRVALIAVGSVGMGAVPVANLNTIGSQADLLKYLQIVVDFSDFGSPGQALAQALGIAVDNNFMSAGYRTTITNHVIVYVTATTKFDDNPAPVATKILQAGSYGIITVGYGQLATDKAALQSISGGSSCTFTASDSATLNAQITSVRNLITVAGTNGGKYCNGGN